MKTFIVIPTYNERENAPLMAEAVLKAAPDAHLLFVDDNSPDGTGEVIEALIQTSARGDLNAEAQRRREGSLSKKETLCASAPLRLENPPAASRLHCLHRERKEGLGRAYVAGFARALELGAGRIVQMDCDFSHDPADLPRLLAEDADLVIGSRYVPGGATPGWPFKRRLISRAGGLFIRTVTGMPLRDPTGGFKAWTARALERIDFSTVASAGYSFQLEMNHRAWKAGLAIREIPISFTDRTRGVSKITPGIAVESVKIALKLRFKA